MSGETARGGFGAHDPPGLPGKDVATYGLNGVVTVFIDTSADADDEAWIKADNDAVLTVGGGGD